MIASSFDKCGIISRNLADYSSQLRHFVHTNIFVHEIVPIDDKISDQTNQLQGDDWDPALEAIWIQKATLNKRYKNEQEKLF